MTEEEAPISLARYVSRAEADGVSVELSFTGSGEVGKPNPDATNVNVRCLKLTNEHVPDSPWTECWSRAYGDLEMPGGVWNGIRLVEIQKARVFLALSNKLCEVSAATGEVVWEVETGNTPIRQLMSSKKGDRILVLNEYSGFSRADDLGNISAVQLGGDLAWRARSPGSNDVFANPMHYENGRLSSGSWRGYDCHIDESTGEILEMVFTK